MSEAAIVFWFLAAVVCFVVEIVIVRKGVRHGMSDR